jgi:hypothetical protein
MTLEEVKLDFEAWRIARRNKGVSIPSGLWQKVYDIHQNYKQTQICKTLSLSGQQFKNKMTEFASLKFVEIPIISITSNDNHCCQIKLTHGNKVLSFELSVNYMDLIIPSLEKLMQ